MQVSTLYTHAMHGGSYIILLCSLKDKHLGYTLTSVIAMILQSTSTGIQYKLCTVSRHSVYAAAFKN